MSYAHNLVCQVKQFNENKDTAQSTYEPDDAVYIFKRVMYKLETFSSKYVTWSHDYSMVRVIIHEADINLENFQMSNLNVPHLEKLKLHNYDVSGGDLYVDDNNIVAKNLKTQFAGFGFRYTLAIFNDPASLNGKSLAVYLIVM